MRNNGVKNGPKYILNIFIIIYNFTHNLSHYSIKFQTFLRHLMLFINKKCNDFERLDQYFFFMNLNNILERNLAYLSLLQGNMW